MDLIMTGVSASERQRRDNLVAAIRNLMMEKMQIGGPSMRMTEVKKPYLSVAILFLDTIITICTWTDPIVFRDHRAVAGRSEETKLHGSSSA